MQSPQIVVGLGYPALSPTAGLPREIGRSHVGWQVPPVSRETKVSTDVSRGTQGADSP